MKGSRLVMILVAGLAAMVGIAAVAGAATLFWILGVYADPAGFVSSPPFQLQGSGYALTAPLDLTGFRNIESTADGTLGTLRIGISDTGNGPVFIGVASRTDAETYLGGVPLDRVSGLGISPWTVSTKSVAGTRSPEQPESQQFWTEWTSGPGTRTLVWPIRPGNWELVVMNADASPGISLETRLAIHSGALPIAAFGIGGFGVLLMGAAVMLLYAALRPTRELVARRLPEAVRGAYPLRLEASLERPAGRLLWLVKWLLVIPHLLALCLLWTASALATFAAGVAILFTGRYPRPIFDFNVGVLRWQWRVAYYSVGAFATDEYPPFSLEAEPSYPATLEVEYPEHLSRGLVLVKSWLLAIPHYLVLGILSGGWILGWDSWRTMVSGGLIGLLALVAVITLAVSGRYPSGLFDLLMGLNRWVFRVLAYALLMTDEYPPFRLEMGGEDPPSPEPSAPEPARPHAGEPL
ncbi:MAG: DUF4389 domain-containing protein [Actinomycetota bacterium]|nr:DUF4389 domain-containing protein [Actinomycetota bacterium]